MSLHTGEAAAPLDNFEYVFHRNTAAQIVLDADGATKATKVIATFTLAAASLALDRK